jgi:hypothetical protein
MPASKHIAAAVLVAGFALLASGCITVGYDFVNQRATLTYTYPADDGLKK